MAQFLYPNCAKIIFIDSKIKQMKLTYKYYINVYKKMICEIVFVYIYKKKKPIFIINRVHVMELQLGQRYELTVLSEPQFSIKGFLANLFNEW